MGVVEAAIVSEEGAIGGKASGSGISGALGVAVLEVGGTSMNHGNRSGKEMAGTYKNLMVTRHLELHSLKSLYPYLHQILRYLFI